MSYRDKIKERKRQEFRDRQQHNRIVGQLNRLYGAGRTEEEVRAAGTDAWLELGGQDIYKDPQTGQWVYKGGKPTNYTVKDGDTLTSIAQQNGTTETDILNANPDTSKIQTGLVMNIPGSPGWQGAAITDGSAIHPPSPTGGIGLPSNAALGGTTNNPQGMNAYKQSEWTYKSNTPMNPNNRYATGYQGNPLSSLWNSLIGSGGQQPNMKTPQGIQPGSGRVVNPMSGLFGSGGQQPYTRGPRGVLPVTPQTSPTQPGGAFQNAINAMVNRTPSSAPLTSTISPAGLGYQPHSVTKWQNYFKGLINQAELPTFNPSETELNWMKNLGLIKKSTTSSGGGDGYSGYGGYSYRRGGGGGGGGRGGGGGYSRVPQGPRRRAFSTGSQFSGLVNWRL